jgi:hypothetical protein
MARHVAPRQSFAYEVPTSDFVLFVCEVGGVEREGAEERQDRLSGSPTVEVGPVGLECEALQEQPDLTVTDESG